MSFVQNFPFFSIILSLLCTVVSFILNGKWARRLTLFLLCAGTALQTCTLLFCCRGNIRYTYMMGHFAAPWGNELSIGILEASLALLFGVVMLLSVLGGSEHVATDVALPKQHLYWLMVDLTYVSLLLLCYTNDIFTGYVFIEISTIAACSLLAAKEVGRALIASVRYMIFALIGSGLFLIGVILTYSITGELLFPQLRTAVTALWEAGTYRFSMTVAIGLMTVGLSIKSGLFPFHFWLPDAHGQATAATSGILSGVIIKGYIVLLIKIIYQVVGIDIFRASGIQNILLIFGVGGMVVCSISAIGAPRLKTMVAFSSAAQVGYIFMGLGLGTHSALLAVLFQIFAHALTKPMLFLSSSSLMDASGGRQDFRSLWGAGHRYPMAGFTFTVGALSMVGIPLLAGFIPKLYFALAAFGMGWRTWVVLLALTVSTILNVMYFLYTTILIWLPGEERTHVHERVRPRMGTVCPAMLLAGLNLLVGIHSAALAALFTQGIDLFCQ